MTVHKALRGVPAPFYLPELTAELLRPAPGGGDHLRLMPLSEARRVRPTPLTLLLEDPARLGAQLRLPPGWVAVEGGPSSDGLPLTWPVLTRLWNAWVAALPTPPGVTFTGAAALTVCPALQPGQSPGEALLRRAAVITQAVRHARELESLPADRGEVRAARAALARAGQVFPTQGRASYEHLWTYTDGEWAVQVDAAQETVTWTDGRQRRRVSGLTYHLTFPGSAESLDLRGAAPVTLPDLPASWTALRLPSGLDAAFSGPDEPALLLRDGAPVRVVNAPGRWALP